LRHPLGALGEELEVGIGVNVEDVDELGLEQGADVHPFLVHLLHSATRGETKRWISCSTRHDDDLVLSCESGIILGTDLSGSALYAYDL
jgi:hypothetical protein